jgi:N-acetylneuraminate synthase
MRPYIIAELSANHNGSLDRALDLVDVAAACGCDAIKLQTYTPDDMTLDLPFQADGLWRGRSLYSLYQQAQTPWEWHDEIFALAREKGLDCISTPFSLAAVDFLADKVDAFKIASFENNWYDLIRYAARLQKPMFISLGMASVNDAVEAWRQGVVASKGVVHPTLLHCVSSYPAKLEDMHLANIANLQRLLPAASIGLSDHTLGYEAAVIATAMGAVAIEKHLCLSRAEGGPDSAFSLEPHEMADLVRAVRDVRQAIGDPLFGKNASENTYYRRSLIAKQDIPTGCELTAHSVGVLRPNIGLPPEALHEVVGRRAGRNIKRGEGIKWQDLA